MYSLMFAGFAVAQLALFVWLVRLTRAHHLAAGYVLLVPQFFLIWDNTRVALGALIGFGDFLYAITWPAFWSHWLTGCWLIIASGSILRLAGISWAQHRWVMGAFCLLATALITHDLPLFWTKEIYPVCEYDLIRYAGSVSESTRCTPDQALVSNTFPVAPVVTCFVVMLAGLVLWRTHGMPWMTIGGVVMLLTAAVPALNRHRLDNLGEVFIQGGAIVTLWLLMRRANLPAGANQSPPDPLSAPTPTAKTSSAG
jgi:hypothetical protein